MLAVALLPFVAFALLAMVPMFDDPLDDVVEDDPVDPMDAEDPVDPATLGATFAATDDNVTIEFGENETGRLAVFTVADPSSFGPLEGHEARYYLVPEGVEWPDNTSETRLNVPGNSSSFERFEEEFDLTLLGTIDLLAQGNDMPVDRNMAEALPALTTNAQTDYYYVGLTDDSSDLLEFLPEGYLVTRNGVEETPVTEDTTGTDANEWFLTETVGTTLDGAGGDDTLDGNAMDLVLIGGEGDDDITATRGGASVEGGAGDDDIFASGADVAGGAGDDSITALDSTVRGGDGDDDINFSGGGESTGFGDAGNDFLTTFSAAPTSLYGGIGDDNLSATLAGNGLAAASLFGGEGNDFLGVGNGTVGFGETGDDTFQVSAGGTADGGDGDDTIRVWDFFGEDAGAATITGGAGADVFDISIRNAFGDATDDIFTEITDFDAEEDMLVVGNVSSGPAVDTITITEDPDGTFTDVEVFFEVADGQTVAVSTIVRLTGVTGLEMDQVVLQ